MSKTRKFLTILTMVAVATTVSLTAVSSAQAHSGKNILWHPHSYKAYKFKSPPPAIPPHNHASHHHGGLKSGQAVALGVIGGVILGSAIANSNKQPAPAAGLPAAHYAYCDGKYKTYVIATDTYTGYDGLQHYCNSPYVY